MRKEYQTEAEFLQFAAKVGNSLPPGIVVYLQGQLGAGKTTFTRGILRGLGFQEKVKSPTYTLVEQYEIAGKPFYHFDLYRLEDPAELLHIGIEEYFTTSSICLIEWPEKGQPWLPAADLTCYIDFMGEGRSIELTATSPLAQALLEKLEVC